MTKILIVEDDDLVRDNLVDLLEAEGFEVVEAQDGQQGLDSAIALTPDLILCDVTMPKLSGYELLELIRKHQSTATIPLILITGRMAQEDFRLGMQLGAEDYLTKPFSRGELVKAISTQLQKRQLLQNTYNQQLQETQNQLEYLIHHDPLTHLPNRLSLQDRFNRLQHLLSGQKGSVSIPLFCLSLERLTRISEHFGYASSDLILQQAAKRLQAALDEEDQLAYLSFNQFAILLYSVTQRQDAIAIAQKLLHTLQQSFTLKEHEVFVSANIGISLFPQNAKTLEDLLNCARSALNYAQNKGGNQYQFFTPTFSKHLPDSLTLEKAFREALERQEFQVYYQPRIDMKTRQVVGAEALLRWIPPDGEPISPHRFIALAEETGTILTLGEWVIRTAVEQAKQWMEKINKPLVIAVNVSGRQFSQADLTQRLAKILSESELESRFLELELTESLLIENPFVARQKLLALKSLGIKIAIDDFGTGYSSLAYLQQFPFDILKIDRCFIQDIADQEKNAAIVQAILQMAQNLNLKVIAEGVETVSELEFLQHHSCDELQGFLFSRPLSSHEFIQLLEKKQKFL